MYWKVGKKSPVHLVSATLCLLHRPHIISLSSSVRRLDALQVGRGQTYSEQRCPTAQTGAAGSRPQADFHQNQPSCKIQNPGFEREKDNRRTLENAWHACIPPSLQTLCKHPSNYHSIQPHCPQHSSTTSPHDHLRYTYLWFGFIIVQWIDQKISGKYHFAYIEEIN